MNIRSVVSLALLALIGTFFYHQYKTGGKTSGLNDRGEQGKVEKQDSLFHDSINSSISQVSQHDTNPNWLVIICPGCNGRGRVYDPFNKKDFSCFMCKGTKKKNIPKLVRGKELCKRCGGWGEILAYGQHCGGRQPTGFVKCRECHGRGIVKSK